MGGTMDHDPSLARAYPLSAALVSLVRAHRNYAAELLREHGLHPGQELLLMSLFERDGQTQSELLDTVGIDPSTVSKSLSRMQQAGLVAREPTAEDRRVLRVRLTAAGEALREPLEGVWRRLESVSAKGLDAEAVAAFARTAGAIERSIRER
ncbi:MarR family winged helix-turn-helix transcriptional regulator [Actinosynnema mirum]|uniref:Transcriptional regulator, MarR family n=1 Tax=Actinosynnema mirum (strain ATCC 29888 / DSM 43827 / JCM 3225 / NBRC 14064 / NCIMB 13271 / NRRL B-12336 / IMRU 3971 / 101) TaxID=446462 RepID=C6WQN3_ACTMD|nr:MarR family transcriptional regulator [Actinosynnema mirum]ACU38723.1 transcriptional regulator, MarR family [Actinosynnema mirum DSM 43827]